ncbi:ACT domain-containing protein [Candidatus Bandiella euplotis]|uniref:GTP pyrophosphokinase C-terminal domain protein n=1 Tax=Candidatus Bandiella euplotis TaxID=1664265 RepID=A0ABZ0UK88_9RICK|nr:ACT domain-containing protein [Candidatus Bandiella woodruffii]WPX96124.1 Putative GTP pyrophosphokinase C-terminal domain protein [Candidatus Bandiella woodruffii]
MKNWLVKIFFRKKVPEDELDESTVLYFADCCFPVKNDQAVKLLNNGMSYSVHRSICLKSSNPSDPQQKSTNFNWDVCKKIKLYKSKIAVLIENEIGNLKTVIDCIVCMRINIFSINTANIFEDFFECTIVVEIEDLVVLNRLLDELGELQAVYSAVRYLES